MIETIVRAIVSLTGWINEGIATLFRWLTEPVSTMVLFLVVGGVLLGGLMIWASMNSYQQRVSEADHHERYHATRPHPACLRCSGVLR